VTAVEYDNSPWDLLGRQLSLFGRGIALYAPHFFSSFLDNFGDNTLLERDKLHFMMVIKSK
jgi:hypothetical protein